MNLKAFLYEAIFATDLYVPNASLEALLAGLEALGERPGPLIQLDATHVDDLGQVPVLVAAKVEALFVHFVVNADLQVGGVEKHDDLVPAAVGHDVVTVQRHGTVAFVHQQPHFSLLQLDTHKVGTRTEARVVQQDTALRAGLQLKLPPEVEKMVIVKILFAMMEDENFKVKGVNINITKVET